ncbi:hypothetical protein KZO01_06230 [Kurthia zopfii]|uniref:Uncharacterized protein n=1 Tax=Kurthia zopfii TaxID=1650 RepID=A0A8B4Q923_9BACL|nr:hypothetical protein [Kurthia zopfii]PWI23508.1 hypothetical protein DF281_02905 [Kurthia zopfii]TDR35536.1 hypothetical protein DFR61_13031 [Kurthia zopfii]GEK30314.1 hypothetical protein KZO01_06230 [Kurthia zopfii]STX09202.1 Uncharacterised protein [Kurthia zopfii]
MNIVIWTAVITAITTLFANILFHLLKNEFDWFTDKKRFKREHAYKQLTELYLELYGIVAQSEYIRKFIKLSKESEFTIYEVPFLEWVVKNTSLDAETKELKVELEQTDVTKYNKSKIDELVIKNSKYASSELLKLCIAHRFCKSNMVKDLEEKTQQDFFDEEVMLLRKIVNKIIIETNELLEITHMRYESNEKASGLMNTNIFKE